MGAENQSLNRDFGEKGVEKISVSDHINGLKCASTKSESFVVNMESISHLVEKEISGNSRITRNLSRKGSLRGGEKRTNFNAMNEKDTNLMVATSPRASLLAANTPEKTMAVTVGTADHRTPDIHNQITAAAATPLVAAANSVTATESKVGGRRFSLRRSSSPSWTIDPRRILIFFATLSSIGTILLIYFTLSMTKVTGEDKASY
ncbi:PREDICTED: uncharacterized protein LOC109231001 isoform X1 [Nicotiana attenuata]|uniref:Uncharacterized protein n=1 Tax=Nicotiana attenuata TaxID=49451 RepID=A0A1J6I4C9_NICAT|nr:PREDICTED: uncharacterized protein LOC109231001 isoform X1 [Nicotiana attenuata]OIS99347.1 hypothetical protein A4A49_35262 [Nicotiana attenuata]